MLAEFRDFIAKGNVMDLAVGIIIGGAFAAITKSLVDDIIMPVVGAVFGGLDFSNRFLPLSSNVTATTLAEAKEQGAVLAYGNFITAIITFVIIAFVVFLMVRQVNKMRDDGDEESAGPSDEVVLLTEIRDSLSKKK